MSDLISRQAALDHLRKRLIQTANNNVGFVCDAGLTFEDASERVKTWLDEVPSIDAVPVIRCKDCKWWTKQEDSLQGRCALHGMYPTGEWFCANARREEE